MENKKKTASIVTLGCRVNQYESDAIGELLKETGFELIPSGSPADVIIINTCTVTSESDRKSRQIIRRAASLSPGAKIIVTGCYAQTHFSEAADINGVTYVTGNFKKSEIPVIAKLLSEGDLGNIPSVQLDMEKAEYDCMTLKSPMRTRSYLKIEDGCDNRCSYCIIPAARGKVRSKPVGVISHEIDRLARGGCREIILTGIEVAAYGRDFGAEPYLGNSLAGIIELTAKSGIERIRLGSLDPIIFNKEFTSRISSLNAVMPHFHLSVQSGSTSVLNRMRRRYSVEKLFECIENAKDAFNGVMLSADIITGFPGETEEEFIQTLEFIKEIGFLHLHIFPYSPRAGTMAAEMDGQLPVEIKNERLKILSEEQKKIKEKMLTRYFMDHREKSVHVLAETYREGHIIGHSEHFVEIQIPYNHNVSGKIVEACLESSNGQVCCGSACRIL